jgi:GAF domain-containing protein/anti-sigma regulatory factor (Ser/Thr protein kinase)
MLWWRLGNVARRVEGGTVRTSAELTIADGRDAIPNVRTFAAKLLRGVPADLLMNVQLVTTELVTNAVLHGAPPIVLRVARDEMTVQVEVRDDGRAVPLRTISGPETMTGRGLSLVEALSVDWGVNRLPAGGKVVWARVGEPAALPANVEGEPELAISADRERGSHGGDRYPVRLGAVPTGLLLGAKAHVDSVARELALLRGEEATSGIALPAPMAGMIRAVIDDFAEARAEIKRQAVAAAHRGEPAVELELSLPLWAAGAGERYLAAMEELDRYARAARLLTLAPPRSHQKFRRWYVQALVDQLRAAAAGTPASAPEPFPEVLAAEVDRLAALQDSQDRLYLLQSISADLTAVTSVDDIATTVVTHAGTYPGVQTARVYLVTDQQTLRSVAWYGGEVSQQDQWEEFPIEAELPCAVVARTGRPLSLRSLAQIYAEFPALSDYYPTESTLHIVPLTIGGYLLGVLAFTFRPGEVTDSDQRSFVQAIADVLAQAVHRAKTAQRVEADRDRDLRLLTAQLDVLADIVAGEPLADALGRLLRAIEAASSDGMLASVLLLDPDGLHLRHCAAPSLPDFYNAAIDGLVIGSGIGSRSTAPLRREEVIVDDIEVDPLWADFRELAATAGLRACWSTPISTSAGELLGMFALYYPRPHRPSAADLALIRVLVRTVTMAVERSHADKELERRFATERAAALSLQHSLLPAVPQQVGPLALQTRYRTGDPGVEVGGDWFDAIATGEHVVLVVGDVQGHDLPAATLMGQLRTVAHASAAEGRDPAQVLEALHHYLTGIDTERLTTAVVVQLDVRTGQAIVASAGHLPPLIVVPGEGGWTAFDVDIDPGPPLGLGQTWPHTATVLPPGALLLLYTDGLVETRSWPLDHGLNLLRETLQAMPLEADLASFLDAALDILPTGLRGDDVALLGAQPNRR